MIQTFWQETQLNQWSNCVPLFLKRYRYNQQFVIELEGVAIMLDVILSVGQDRVSCNPKYAGP